MGNYAPLITQAAAAKGVDPRLMGAIASVESADEPNVVSPAGAEGLFQIMPSTARAMHINPMNPAQAASAAATIIRQNMARYHNPDDAVAAYFAGPNQALWGPKTRAYVEKVAQAYMAQPAQAPAQAPAQPPASAAPSSFDQALAASMGQSSLPAPAAQPVQASMPFEQALAASMKVVPKKKPSMLEQIGAGIKRGANELTDPLLVGVANAAGAGAHALGLLPNWHPGANSARNKARYDANFNNIYGDAKVFSPENVANVASQGVGGAAIIDSGEGVLNAGADALGAGARAAGLDYVGSAVPKIAKFATGGAGTGILAKTASLATEGALQGAAYDKLTGRPVTPQSMLLGAVINPAAHGAGNLIGRAVQSTKGLAPATVQAAREVLAAQRADGNAIAPWAANDTLVSTEGPNVQGLAEELANKPGPGQKIVLDRLNAVRAAHPGMLRQAIKSVLGSDGDIHDLTDDIIKQRSQVASQKFADAFSRIAPTQDEIDTVAPILHSPEGQQGLKTAVTALRRNALANGTEFNPGSIGIFPKGQDGLTVAPGKNALAGLHAAKEGLDDLVEDQRDPYTRKFPSSKEFQALLNLRDSYRNTLASMYPRYETALNSYSGPSRIIDAVGQGRKIFGKDMELTAKKVAAMSPDEKSGFQAGVARAVLDKIDGVNAGSASSNAARMFNNPGVVKKLMAAFDDPAEAQQLMDTAEAINRQAHAAYNVGGSSRTAIRTAQREHDWQNTVRDMAANAAAGRPHMSVLALVRGLINHSNMEGNPETEAALAHLLTNPDRAAVAASLARAQPSAGSLLLGGAARGATRAVPVSALAGTLPSATGTGR